MLDKYNKSVKLDLCFTSWICGLSLGFRDRRLQNGSPEGTGAHRSIAIHYSSVYGIENIPILLLVGLFTNNCHNLTQDKGYLYKRENL